MNKTSFSRIGIWQTAFLGDAVLTLPLVQSLRRAFPEADLVYFVRKGLRPLFQPQPGIEVEEFDKYGRDNGASGLLRQINRIRGHGFDLWVSSHTSFRSALIARSSGSLVRVGYDCAWFTRAAYTHHVSRRFDSLEEIERVLQLLKPLGLEPASTWPRLFLDPESKKMAADFWKHNVSGPVLGIHPGSTWATKKWPVECFARVVDLVRENLDIQIMLFAGPGEEHLAADILARIKNRDRVINMAGRLDLPRLAAFLEGIDCYLCNDSGPMHLAWVQNTPVVAIFGPTTKDLGFFPRGRHSLVLEADLDCRPCGLHGGRHCPEGHHRCMLDIDPETVFKAVKEKLYA